MLTFAVSNHIIVNKPLFTIIIPIYNVNDHLDICLLSILGQVQMDDIEVVCLPLVGCDNIDRLEAWKSRDGRVVIIPESQTLFEALVKGIAISRGSYIMFVNQTDTITSIEEVKKAFGIAGTRDAHVLLAPSLRRRGINAYSKAKRITIDKTLLPNNINEVFSLSEAGIGLLLGGIPLPYGNIYKRSHLASLFQSNHDFGNAGDVIIALIPLLRMERISFIDTPLIESRHEGFLHSLPIGEELHAVENALALQTFIVLQTSEAQTIVRNIMVIYLSWILSFCYPFDTFCQTVEHYKTIIASMTDMTRNDAIPQLSYYWRYLQTVISSSNKELIEVYTLNHDLFAC